MCKQHKQDKKYRGKKWSNNKCTIKYILKRGKSLPLSLLLFPVVFYSSSQWLYTGTNQCIFAEVCVWVSVYVRLCAQHSGGLFKVSEAGAFWAKPFEVTHLDVRGHH